MCVADRVCVCVSCPVVPLSSLCRVLFDFDSGSSASSSSSSSLVLLLRLLFLTTILSLTINVVSAVRYSYPTDCCRYKLKNGFTATDLPSIQRQDQQLTWSENLLVPKETSTTSQTQHCQGNTIAVWSTTNRNFTRRYTSDGVELIGPVSVKDGDTIEIAPMNEATLKQLEGKLVRIDLDCSTDGTSFRQIGRGNDCAFLWLGAEVDPAVKKLPPCLFEPPNNPTTTTTTTDEIQPTSTNTEASMLLIENVSGQTSLAIRKVDFSPANFLIGLFIVCMAIQIMLLFDAVEHIL